MIRILLLFLAPVSCVAQSLTFDFGDLPSASSAEALTGRNVGDVMRSTGLFEIPAGIHTIREPWSISEVSYAQLRGRSASPYGETHGWNRTTPTCRLVFDIPAGEPAIHLTKVRGIDFSRFAITRTTPGPLFQMNFVTGWGVGKMRFSRMGFVGAADADVDGVVFGTEVKEGCNDTSTFDFCEFFNLRAAIVQRNEQSCALRARDCSFHFCKEAVRSERGGDVALDGGDSYGTPIIFRILTAGTNVANFALRDFRVDGNSNGPRVTNFTLFDCSGANLVYATVDGVTVRNATKEAPLRPLYIPARNWKLFESSLVASGHPRTEPPER